MPRGAEWACKETIGLTVLFRHHPSFGFPSTLKEGHAQGVPRPFGLAPNLLYEPRSNSVQQYGYPQCFPLSFSRNRLSSSAGFWLCMSPPMSLRLSLSAEFSTPHRTLCLSKASPTWQFWECRVRFQCEIVWMCKNYIRSLFKMYNCVYLIP